MSSSQRPGQISRLNSMNSINTIPSTALHNNNPTSSSNTSTSRTPSKKPASAPPSATAPPQQPQPSSQQQPPQIVRQPHVAECVFEFLLSEILHWVETECDPIKRRERQQAAAAAAQKSAVYANDPSTPVAAGQSPSKSPPTPTVDHTQTEEELAIAAAEMAAAKIERLGFSVGYRLCERLAQTRPLGTTTPTTPSSSSASVGASSMASGLSSPSTTTATTTTTTNPEATAAANTAAMHLEAVKFLCKEFWMEVFRKQIDKLQTNHRGVFVLKDSELRWLRRLPSDDERARVAAIKMLAFPCGLIRGALSNLGIGAVVSCDFLADGTRMASCSFNIKIKT